MGADMKIDVRSDLGSLSVKLESIGRQARFAVAKALTQTASAVKRETERQIQTKLAAPKAYTTRALFMKSATKATLEAQVALKNVKLSGAKYTQEQTLGHLFVPAETRNHNPLERWLIGNGYMTKAEYLMPTNSATLDAYGNLPRSTVRQIVGQIKGTAGRTRRGVGRIFWADGSGLTRGVWARKGKDLTCIAVVTGEPAYRVRINLEALSRGIVNRHFESNLDKAIDDAIRTAR